MEQLAITVPALTVRLNSHIVRFPEVRDFRTLCRERAVLSQGENEDSVLLYGASFTRTASGETELRVNEENGVTAFYRFRDGDGRVEVEKKGNTKALFRFTEGENYRLTYTTLFGKLDTEIYTESVKNTLTARSGYLYIRYLMSIGGIQQRVALKITPITK